MVTTAVSSDPPGLGPKKTLFVMVTVIGCIGILWPKLIYPMMFAAQAPAKVPVKDYRAGPGGEMMTFLMYFFFHYKNTEYLPKILRIVLYTVNFKMHTYRLGFTSKLGW